jgi:hypothetical protein
VCDHLVPVAEAAREPSSGFVQQRNRGHDDRTIAVVARRDHGVDHETFAEARGRAEYDVLAADQQAVDPTLRLMEHEVIDLVAERAVRLEGESVGEREDLVICVRVEPDAPRERA